MDTLRGTPYLVPRLVNFILDLRVNRSLKTDLFAKGTNSLYVDLLLNLRKLPVVLLKFSQYGIRR